MIYLLAILLFLILVAWLDRIARAQEAAALTLIRSESTAALMNRENIATISPGHSIEPCRRVIP
jgi:hypothetical protein